MILYQFQQQKAENTAFKCAENVAFSTLIFRRFKHMFKFKSSLKFFNYCFNLTFKEFQEYRGIRIAD